jgi:RNA 2',3'-cyclic 3'-phosphodiesterase
MRCFVAVDLPDDVRAAVAAVQADARAAAPRADVGWVDASKMHLTLKFLGEIADDVVADVRAAIERVAGGHAPFELAAGGAGQFPNPARPRVLWVGLTAGLREIGLLAAEIERACLPLGFPLEARPFRGHVTIGRVRSPRGIARVVKAMQAAPAALGAWTARDVVLYRSHLRGAQGSLYEPLARAVLGA